MKAEQIAKYAKDAEEEMGSYHSVGAYTVCSSIYNAIDEALEQATKEERERCAGIAETYRVGPFASMAERQEAVIIGGNIADKIRSQS